MPNTLLLVAAVAFFLVVLWRVRPSFSSEDEPTPPKVRGLEGAKDDAERAELLAAAGDRYAASIGGARRAGSCYARAMRLRPAEVALVTRAAKGLARSPRVLEALAWRRLGATPIDDGSREVTRALLGALVTVYDGAQKTRLRARAIEHLRAALDTKAEKSEP